MLNRVLTPALLRCLSIIVASVLVVGLFGSWAHRRLRDDYHGNFSGFIHLDRARFDDNPLVMERRDIRRSLILLDGPGYDGQFMYYITFDPFLRRFDSYRRVVDYPPYRYGRIGFPLLTRLIAGVHWQRYPETMVELVLGGILVTALGLGLLQDGFPLLGLLVVAIPGFWESLENDLPEPIAAGFVVLGCLLLSRRAIRSAGLCFALSLLIRETGIVFLLAACGAEMLRGRRGTSATLAVIGLSPMLAWRAFVGWSQYPLYGAEAFFVNPHDFGVPFAGILHMWRDVHAGQYYTGDRRIALAAVAYPIVVVFGLVLSLAVAVEAPSPAATAAACYGLIAVSLNYDGIWGGIGGAIRDTFELFVGLAIATGAWQVYRRRTRIALLVFWTASAAFVFLLSAGSDAIRSALIFWR